MPEKILCKCGWCLYKNPEGVMITQRIRRRHEQRFEAVELDNNGLVKGVRTKKLRVSR